MSECEWLTVLDAQCQKTSQSRVARKLGVSATMINQALKRVYKGNIDALRERVEGAYMGRHSDCPVLGEIPVNECIDHQKRPFSATNPQRVRLYRACRNGCPYSRLEGQIDE